MSDTDRDAQEINFDGLVGPTHNYAGLSLGNRASMSNAGAVANPRAAARQGLAKMRRLVQLGLPQAVLPPHQRPDPNALLSLGFNPGTPMTEVAKLAPSLPAVLMSASPMWAANAATVSPSADTADGRVHRTPAKLSPTTPPCVESRQTCTILRAILSDRDRFAVHEPLPLAPAFADEGAANHGRLVAEHGATGIHMFVYGREADEPPTGRFPRRQTRLAGQLIARSHGLHQARVRFVRQSDAAIDAGAFHNDVVSVVNQDVVLTHEAAFEEGPEVAARIPGARMVVVPQDRVPLDDAIASYLFNSQLITRPDGTMTLVAPAEVEETPSTAAWVAEAVADPDNPLDGVEILDLRESMRNGGGPACLRLRVVLTGAERAAVQGRILVDEAMLDRLEVWVDEHYRDALHADDLLDPALEDEALRALDELTGLLELPGLYPFQR